MADNESIEGLDLILKKLETLSVKASGRVLATVIRAQLNVIGKQMKADVDSKVKEGRKGVRSRFKNKAKKNFITAKVGFGVGKKRKAGRTLKLKGNRREGQGIGAQSIHWWVAGTKSRRTGLNRPRNPNPPAPHDTGRMPSFQPGLAKIAATKSRGQQNKEMIKRGALALQKEVLKIQNMR
jgi:hypothetical protein